MICFHCGRRLLDALGRRTRGVTRKIPVTGQTVHMHKDCSEDYDDEQEQLHDQVLPERAFDPDLLQD